MTESSLVMKERLLKYLRNEPMVRFAAMAGLLFLLHAWTTIPSDRMIVVTPKIVTDLEEARQEILGRPLSEDERQQLIANYINEEVLLREAYARQMDRQDAKIRHRLVDKMRFLLTKEPLEPSRQELEVFYGENLQTYQSPPRITFEHIYFSSGAAEQQPHNLIDQLRAGADPDQFGGDFWLGRKLVKNSRPDLTAVLGSEFTHRVFEMPLHEWNGPISTPRGTHFVRVSEKLESVQMPFETIVPILREDWFTAKRKSSLDEKVAELKEGYRIEILSDGEES